VRRENEKESGETSESDAHIDIHPAVNQRLKVMNKKKVDLFILNVSIMLEL
jgi:hypothetical protein